jgi:hypothetical protein
VKTYRDPVDWSIRVVASDEQKPNERSAGSPATDVKAWLAANGPRNHEELRDLRRALYSRDTHGSFTIRHHSSGRSGELRFSIVGRKGSLLIVSDKSRHFLLRQLCSIAKRTR